jgi:hypothetical protein
MIDDRSDDQRRTRPVAVIRLANGSGDDFQKRSGFHQSQYSVMPRPSIAYREAPQMYRKEYSLFAIRKKQAVAVGRDPDSFNPVALGKQVQCTPSQDETTLVFAESVLDGHWEA